MRAGTVEDIMEFIPDLLLFYTQIDDQNAENEINLDWIESAEYIRLKKWKKDWQNSYSDLDINKLSKEKARRTYDRLPADKKVAEHWDLKITEYVSYGIHAIQKIGGTNQKNILFKILHTPIYS